MIGSEIKHTVPEYTRSKPHIPSVPSKKQVETDAEILKRVTFNLTSEEKIKFQTLITASKKDIEKEVKRLTRSTKMLTFFCADLNEVFTGEQFWDLDSLSQLGCISHEVAHQMFQNMTPNNQKELFNRFIQNVVEHDVLDALISSFDENYIQAFAPHRSAYKQFQASKNKPGYHDFHYVSLHNKTRIDYMALLDEFLASSLGAHYRTMNFAVTDQRSRFTQSQFSAFEKDQEQLLKLLHKMFDFDNVVRSFGFYDMNENIRSIMHRERVKRIRL